MPKEKEPLYEGEVSSAIDVIDVVRDYYSSRELPSYIETIDEICQATFTIAKRYADKQANESESSSAYDFCHIKQLGHDLLRFFLLPHLDTIAEQRAISEMDDEAHKAKLLREAVEDYMLEVWYELLIIKYLLPHLHSNPRRKHNFNHDLRDRELTGLICQYQLLLQSDYHDELQQAYTQAWGETSLIKKQLTALVPVSREDAAHEITYLSLLVASVLLVSTLLLLITGVIIVGMFFAMNPINILAISAAVIAAFVTVSLPIVAAFAFSIRFFGSPIAAKWLERLALKLHLNELPFVKLAKLFNTSRKTLNEPTRKVTIEDDLHFHTTQSLPSVEVYIKLRVKLSLDDKFERLKKIIGKKLDKRNAYIFKFNDVGDASLTISRLESEYFYAWRKNHFVYFAGRPASVISILDKKATDDDSVVLRTQKKCITGLTGKSIEEINLETTMEAITDFHQRHLDAAASPPQEKSTSGSSKTNPRDEAEKLTKMLSEPQIGSRIISLVAMSQAKNSVVARKKFGENRSQLFATGADGLARSAVEASKRAGLLAVDTPAQVR